MVRSALFALAAAALLAAVPASAQAGWPGFYGCNNWSSLWGNPYVYSQGGAYIPPYFAMHPPVYYSPHITARPYGASPFPLPYGPVSFPKPVGYVAAPPAEPMEIVNPYVAQPAPAQAAAEKNLADEAVAEVEPLRIENPYVVSK
jgi:hypothetical protein